MSPLASIVADKKAHELVAFLVQDVGCAGFWCAQCERVHLHGCFGFHKPHCTNPKCHYRYTGYILKNCGTVGRAFELGPDPAASSGSLRVAAHDPLAPFHYISEAAAKVVDHVAQRRKDRT